MKINFALATLLGLTSAKEGISFVVVGDFAVILDLMMAKNVFDKIDNMKKNAVPGSAEDFDFFVTVGDNLYVKRPQTPTQHEFNEMMNLFETREHIKKLPIYPVRGNHDCKFDDMYAEVNLTAKHPTWQMPNNYYRQDFPIGANGEKFSLLHVDSCFLLCAEVHQDFETLYPLLDHESKEVFDSNCEKGSDYHVQSSQMMDWIVEQMNDQSADPNIIWKASTMHHPMFAMHYADNQSIIKNFLPLAQKHGYDAYFCGHEHMQNYVQVPMTPTPDLFCPNEWLDWSASDKNCHLNFEWFPQDGPEKETRKVSVEKGEYINQITAGASGCFPYNICTDSPTKGKFIYTENKYHGFSLVTVTPDKFQVDIKGASSLPFTKEIELLSIEVKNTKQSFIQ